MKGYFSYFQQRLLLTNKKHYKSVKNFDVFEEISTTILESSQFYYLIK